VPQNKMPGKTKRALQTTSRSIQSRLRQLCIGKFSDFEGVGVVLV
jgi:hypothetical protein